MNIFGFVNVARRNIEFFEAKSLNIGKNCFASFPRKLTNVL